MRISPLSLPAGKTREEQVKLAVINAPIIVPATGRDLYAATQTVAVAGRARDDLRTSAIDSVRFVDAQSDTAQSSAQAGDHWQQSTANTATWTQVVSARPQQTLPFLTQLLAQQDTSEEAGNEASQPLPSVRFTARQAYLASRDSTIQYLSPTPLYDLFV